MADPTRNTLIVGFGPGVGQAVAQAFAAEGFSLALLARSREKVEAAADAFAATGSVAAAFPADAGDERSLETALAAARLRFGDPDVLVYNAANWRPGPTLAMRPDELVDDVRLCAVGALVAARTVAPAMKAAGRGSP